jgi:iron complex outermembrane receptor protein
MKFMKRAYLASAAATALTLAMSNAANAQDSDVEEISDEVVSTGIRQSIENSLRLKKNSSSIVEAITSEDIGKLPDVSIADSLARLPGVTAQRVRGRAQQISIRGLGPDFSIALLNGREVVSAGNNRGIEFDQFPSELISQGVVYKTPDARLAATGIAGAVDLRTVKPLDYNDRQINLSGKYVLNDNGALNPDFGADGYRLFGSYINQFAEDRVGVALAITHQSNPTQIVSRELKTAQGQTGDFNGVRIPTDNPRTGSVSRDFERTSVAGTLQFNPTDRFNVTGDVLFTDSQDAGIFRGIETPIASWSGANPTAATGSGPFAETATYENVGPILRTDTEGNEVETLALGLNVAFEVTDNLSVLADLSRSTLERNDVDYESYAGAGRGIIGSGSPLLDTITYTFPENGAYSASSSRDYTDSSSIFLTDPGGWGQVGFLRSPDIDDELEQVRLEAEYDLDAPFIEGVVAGYLKTDRVKSFTDNAFFIRPGNGFVDSTLAIPSNSIVGVTDDGGTGFPIIAYDPSSFLTDGTYLTERTQASAYIVEESIDTFYAMANIDHQLGNVPVRGNFGIQYVDTSQASNGTNAALGPDTIPGNPVSFEFDDWLPTANLSFEVADDTFLRLAFAESLTRPRLDQLAANTSASFNSNVCVDTDLDQIPDTFIDGAFNPPQQTCLNFSSGNPFLQPYHATSYDVSFEKYFGGASAFSIAGYVKDLSEYVQDTQSAFDVGGLASELLGDAFVSANPNASIAQINGPTNLENGTVKGIELSLRLSLEDFFEQLSGFGVNASYTYTDTNVELESGQEVRIPGFSSDVASGEVYYEKDGFRARLNGRYRSGFLSEIQEFNGGLTGAEALSEFILDAQIGYEWDEGALEGLSVNIEAYNLTDEPFRTENEFNGNGDTFVSRREDYGRTFNFTVAKKF